MIKILKLKKNSGFWKWVEKNKIDSIQIFAQFLPFTRIKKHFCTKNFENFCGSEEKFLKNLKKIKKFKEKFCVLNTKEKILGIEK